MHPGWIGGIIGGLAGLAGGIIGSYFSIKSTHGQRERAFMIKSVVLGSRSCLSGAAHPPTESVPMVPVDSTRHPASNGDYLWQ